MAKDHPTPSPAGAGAHAPLATMRKSSSASQLSLQLRQDLAKLAHKDPDTRRSSMEALKGFIEGELDAQMVPIFLEQVSGETNKGSSSYAISLLADVARVHKQVMVPFIPRIMTVVLRCVPSPSGGTGHSNNLHQACANVVSAMARYALDPASHSGRSSSSADVLDSLCQPLLGLLCSKVEPTAVGSAMCLQAIVEEENWKWAAPELVHDVCSKSSTALVDKGKHTIMHLHLVRSLAKFNPGALQEYGASLLKVGVHILTGSMGNLPACAPWQQRVAATQLLGTLLGYLEQQIIAPELIPTMEALDSCRHDKVAMVRQAVGEALAAARSLTPSTDPLLLHKGPPVAKATMLPLSCSRLSDAKKHNRRQKSQSCGSTVTSGDMVLGSQESKAFSYASSPSSSITKVLTPLASPSSAIRSGQSPLFPAKQPPVFLSPSLERCMTELEAPYLLALKSSDSKGKLPLVCKSGELLVTRKSDGLGYAVNGSGNKIMEEVGNDEEVMHVANDNTCTKEHEQDSVLQEADLGSEIDFVTDNRVRKLPETWEQQAWRSWELLSSSPELETRGSQEWSGDLTASTCCTLLPTKDNMQRAACVQMSKKCMSDQDFLIFSTPRRFVQSLQSASSTPQCSPERDQGVNLEYETLSESGWSVRDNPIAGGSSEEDYSPRKRPISGRKHLVMPSKEVCSCHEGDSMIPVEDEKRIDCLRSGVTIDSTWRSSGDSSPLSGFLDVPEMEDHKGWIGKAQIGGAFDNTSVADTKSGHSDSPEEKGIVGLKEKGMIASKPTRVWVFYLEKLHHYVEVFLFGALLIVLVFTAFITIANCIRGPHNRDILVPT